MLFLPLCRLFVAAAYQNVDNFALAAAYRIKNVVIPWRANLLIALFSGLATGIAVISGYASGQGIDVETEHLGLGSISGITGRGILIMIGVWILISYLRSKLFRQLNEARIPNPAEAVSGRDQNTPVMQMRNAESLIVAIALAADNLGPSFFLGWAGLIRNDMVLSTVVLFVLTTAWSVVAVAWGQLAGEKGRTQLRFLPAEIVSGCLILAIALFDSDAVLHSLLGH